MIVNPQLSLAGSHTEFFEGCLSVAGFSAIVSRSLKARVGCLDEKGQAKTICAEGWYARILQHEIDHLEGTLYLDRMYARSFMTVDHMMRHCNDLAIEDVKQRLGIG